MGERSKTSKVAPPADVSTGIVNSGVVDKAASSADPSLFAEYWPPSGWPMFACVTRPSGTVIASEMGVRGDQALLKYEVRIENGVYTIEILKGTLARSGGITLQPALSIRFTGLEDWFEENLESAVLNIDVDGQSIRVTRDVVLRLILAMTFLISRIDRGLMPNLKKTLKIYRLG